VVEVWIVILIVAKCKDVQSTM